MSTSSRKKKPAATADATPSLKPKRKRAVSWQKRSSVTARRAKLESKPKTLSNAASKQRTNPESKEKPTLQRTTKQNAMLALLSRKKGATLEELMRASGWQNHSVRGFLAGTVKKKLSLPLTSVKSQDGLRRYRIAAAVES